MLADEGEERDQNGEYGHHSQRDAAGAGRIGTDPRHPRAPMLRAAVGDPCGDRGVEVVALLRVRPGVAVGKRRRSHPEAAVETGQAFISRHAAER